MSFIEKYVQIGDKIRVNERTNSYSKPTSLDGLYSEGDELTVKSLGSMYPYSGIVHYIKEVEEFPTPVGIDALLVPNEWDVVWRTEDSARRMLDFQQQGANNNG